MHGNIFVVSPKLCAKVILGNYLFRFWRTIWVISVCSGGCAAGRPASPNSLTSACTPSDRSQQFCSGHLRLRVQVILFSEYKREINFRGAGLEVGSDAGAVRTPRAVQAELGGAAVRKVGFCLAVGRQIVNGSEVELKVWRVKADRGVGAPGARCGGGGAGVGTPGPERWRFRGLSASTNNEGCAE